MGRDCAATSSLVYGIIVKVPESPCWPLFLKRLKRAANDESLAVMAARAVPAESLKKGDDDHHHDTTELPEPIAKYARATKCILVSCDEAETEKGEDVNEDEPWDDGDGIAVINYLSDHEDNIPKAAKAAFDRALGPGHGLLMKIYYGHDEDTSNVALLLQVEEAGSSSSGRIHSFQGVSMTKVDAILKDKEKTDTLIKKALDVFCLEVQDGEEPGWIMATTCCYYP